jgi:phosphopantetheinyl transferase
MDNIDFNVSHHGEWVVIAACSYGKIGIDVTRNELPSERIDAFIECFADQVSASFYGSSLIITGCQLINNFF